jgi:hypothetical protein
MKLRLHSGTLRLRLSQPEVAQLAETGRLEDTVTFAPGQVLSYALESGPEAGITATLAGNRIRVAVPAAIAKHWIESDETGIESSGGALQVLIEKDFQCLHRVSEEDADSFPNPMASDRS